MIRINRLGRSIEEKYADRYFNEIGLGVDFTARDLQAEQKKKGLPWEIAKGFDYSAPVSEFFPVEKYQGYSQSLFQAGSEWKDGAGWNHFPDDLQF